MPLRWTDRASPDFPSDHQVRMPISSTCLRHTGNPLDPATLVTSFKSGSEPDYEIPSDNGEDGTYELFIEVEDGNVPAGKDEIELHLVVADLNEAPAFASLVDLNASVQENQNFVGTLSATDQDAGTPNYHWEIIGGADQNYFQLSASSGDYVDLNFTYNPDFESPLDSGTNNTYEVIVKVWGCGFQRKPKG